MKSALIRVHDALCRIGRKRVLHVPHFEISQGQHYCVFGGNGAGKSSFVQLLLGRLAGGSSHVEYLGDLDPVEDIIVVSFEEQQALWALDSRHDISEFSADAMDQGTTVAAWVLGVRESDVRYREILAGLGLEDLEGRGMRFLSSGQCRKAMLAKALLQQPRLLVLDNPLDSVDRASQQQIKSALSQWMSPDHCTLLLCRRAADILPGVTHMALMDDLALIADGPLESMLTDSRYITIAERELPIPDSLPVLGMKALRAPLLPEQPLLALHKVCAGYPGKRVLENFSWTMWPGQHTLIEGPNGCGKSTLLSLIDGENHMAYGQDVWLFGRKRGSGETVWEVKARFGVVSNEIHNRYVKGWRVLEVVVSGYFDSIGLYDDSGACERDGALAWLRALHIDFLAHEDYHALSFGQQRLVLLARAMVKQPDILILDEPCVGLDDAYRGLILGVVDLIASTTGTHILYVSHTLGEQPSCINQNIRFENSGVFITDMHTTARSESPASGLAKPQQ